MADTVEIDILCRTEQAVSNMEKFVKSIAASIISYQAFKRLIVDSVKAFLDAEQAETRLAVALKTTGQYTQEAANHLSQYATALQANTIYEDDATKAAAALLLQIGHLTTEGVQRAIPVLMDYASAMGVDLATAATQFAQAIEGGRNVFQRYGISLKDAEDPTSRFNKLIEGLSNNFTGMADALSKTTGGQLKEFQNQISEFQETVGGFFAEIFGPGLKFVNQNLSFKRLVGLDLSTMDRATLESWRNFLIDYQKTLRETPHWGQQKQLQDAATEMMAINTAISKLPISPKGKVVTGLLGDDPDKGLERIFIAYNMISAMYGTGMTNASIWAHASMGTPGGVRVVPGTGMEYPGGSPPAQSGTPGQGAENPGAYQPPEDWIRKQKEELRELEKQWREVGQAVASFGQALGAALATGDWEAAFRSMIVQITNLIVNYAVAAAAAAAVAFNWPMVAFWLGIAGIAAVGGGFVGAGGLSGGGENGPNPNLPHYASGTNYVPRTGLAVVHQGEQIIPAGGRGGGNTNIYVYGGVWQADQLARQLAGAMRKW